MKVLLQRVQSASVAVNGEETASIGHGLLLFLGIGRDDTVNDARYLVDKLLELRLFADENGKMNKSVANVKGDILIVSQFTLYANCKKGTRPSFTNAKEPKEAEELYNHFIDITQKQYRLTGAGGIVATGVFGAMMEISLVNDGPVTVMLDTNELIIT